MGNEGKRSIKSEVRLNKMNIIGPMTFNPGHMKLKTTPLQFQLIFKTTCRTLLGCRFIIAERCFFIWLLFLYLVEQVEFFTATS